MLDFIEKLKRGEQVMQAAAAAPQQTGYGAPAAPRVHLLPSIVELSLLCCSCSACCVLVQQPARWCVQKRTFLSKSWPSCSRAAAVTL